MLAHAFMVAAFVVVHAHFAHDGLRLCRRECCEDVAASNSVSAKRVFFKRVIGVPGCQRRDAAVNFGV